jgi:hypothetical protein
MSDSKKRRVGYFKLWTPIKPDVQEVMDDLLPFRIDYDDNTMLALYLQLLAEGRLPLTSITQLTPTGVARIRTTSLD